MNTNTNTKYKYKITKYKMQIQNTKYKYKIQIKNYKTQHIVIFPELFSQSHLLDLVQHDIA